MWLKRFKIALIEKNVELLSSLLNSVPQLKKKEEMEEAIYLLKSATELIQSLKDSTSDSMKQMKKNLEYLKSTQAPRKGKLDIKS